MNDRKDELTRSELLDRSVGVERRRWFGLGLAGITAEWQTRDKTCCHRPAWIESHHLCLADVSQDGRPLWTSRVELKGPV